MKIKKNGLLSLLLCMVMIFATVVNPAMVYAADEDALIANNLVTYEERTDVASFRGTTNVAPTKDNFVFAGWYKEVGGEKVPMTAAEADAATSAFAKFVDAKVHGVKFQLAANTINISTATDLRMVTTVDSLNYASVGFKITIGELSTERHSTTVYETITGYTSDGVTSYTPSGAFETDAAAYFMSYQVTGVPNSYFDSDITVTTTWTTLDGTVVDNTQPRTFTVDEFASQTKLGIDGNYPGICVVAVSGTAGQKLSFDVIAPEGVPYAFYLLLDGAWGAGSEFQFNEQTKHVEVVLGKDITFIQLQGAGSNVQLEFENITITTPLGIDGNFPGILQYQIAGTAGQKLSFDVIAPEGVSYAFYLLLDGAWGAGSEFQFNEQTKHVEVVLGKDITFIQLQGAGSGVQLEFENITITTPLGIDGNFPGILQYQIAGTAGQKLSFDVIAPEGVPYAFYLLLDGAWGAGSEFQFNEQTKHVEVVLGKDITFIQLQGAGSGVQLEFENITITTPLGIDGNFPGILQYPIEGTAGQTISFDVIAPEGVPYSFWLLLDGNWGAGNEFHIYETTKHVEVVLDKDITFLQFQGAGSGVQLEFENIQVQ